MILFWSAAGLLLAAVLAGLLWPLLRRPRGGGEDAAAVAVFRRQFAQLEADAAEGRLAPEAEAAARDEIARRLLASAGRGAEDAAMTAGGPAEASWRIGAAIAISALVPAAAIALYLWVGAPLAPSGSAAAETAIEAHQAAELAAAADALAARVKADPKDLQAWLMLARTATALERLAEARDAYRRAIALAPDRPELHAELGEVLVLEAAGVVTPAATAEFGQAGTDVRARYYLAEAALQQGDTAKGESLLRALLADAPAEAPWRKFVAERLARLAPASAAGAAAAGPSAQDVAAAAAMSPAARDAVIRGMVARLAARLEQHPDDPDGWTRLAHAYDVLGEPQQAAAARARAAAPAASPAAR
jgi:cytochrome c-type biogenesis protein CcmH